MLSLLALLQAAIWGLGNTLTKIAYEYTTPFMLLAIRFTVATVLFAVFFGKRIGCTIKTLKIGPALITGLTTAAAFIFAYQSLAVTDATTAGFLMAISVIFMPFFAWLVQGTKPDKKIIPIIVVVTVGMYLLCGGGQFSFGWGEAMAVMSSISYGFCLVFSARFLEKTDPVALTFSQCLITAVVCWGFGLIFEPLPNIAAFDTRAYVVVGILAVGCSFVCYLIQNYVLVGLPSTLTALILCSESVFSAVGAYFLLGERLEAVGVVGAAIILIGVVLATLFASKNESEPPEIKGEQNA